jgi:hypothetical protein
MLEPKKFFTAYKKSSWLKKKFSPTSRPSGQMGEKNVSRLSCLAIAYSQLFEDFGKETRFLGKIVGLGTRDQRRNRVSFLVVGKSCIRNLPRHHPGVEPLGWIKLLHKQQ